MAKKKGTVPQWPSHEWPTPEGRYGPKPNLNLPPIKKAKKKKKNRSKLTIA